MNTKEQFTSSENTTSQHKLFETGPKMEASESLDSGRMENESMSFPMLNESSTSAQSSQSEGSFSTQESPLQHKRKISDVNQTCSSSCTHNTTESSPTLGRVLTLKGKDCQPFWNSSAKAWSQMLWSCTKTDLQEWVMTSSSKYAVNLTQNSWFTVKTKRTTTALTTTLSQSSQALLRRIMENVQREIEKEEQKKAQAQEKKKQKLQKDNEERAQKAKDGISDEDREKLYALIEDVMAYEDMIERGEFGQMTKAQIQGKIKRCHNDIKKIEKSYEQLTLNTKEKVDKILRSKNIKVKPTKEEMATFDQWIGASRFVYNKCVAYSKLIDMKSMKATERLRIFRDHVRGPIASENTWLKDVNANIIDKAIGDFCKAYSSNVAKLVKKMKKNESFSFSMKFRSKKVHDPRDTQN